MLLHVIWGFVDEIAHECPTFSVSGVMLQWADQSPALVKQGRFEWRHDAWEAKVQVTASGAARQEVPGVMRVHPEVLESWTTRSLNPRSEAARQLREAVRRRGSSGHLGVVTLTE